MELSKEQLQMFVILIQADTRRMLVRRQACACGFEVGGRSSEASMRPGHARSVVVRGRHCYAANGPASRERSSIGDLDGCQALGAPNCSGLIRRGVCSAVSKCDGLCNITDLFTIV